MKRKLQFCNPILLIIHSFPLLVTATVFLHYLKRVMQRVIFFIIHSFPPVVSSMCLIKSCWLIWYESFLLCSISHLKQTLFSLLLLADLEVFHTWCTNLINHSILKLFSSSDSHICFCLKQVFRCNTWFFLLIYFHRLMFGLEAATTLKKKYNCQSGTRKHDWTGQDRTIG